MKNYNNIWLLLDGNYQGHRDSQEFLIRVNIELLTSSKVQREELPFEQGVRVQPGEARGGRAGRLGEGQLAEEYRVAEGAVFVDLGDYKGI